MADEEPTNAESETDSAVDPVKQRRKRVSARQREEQAAEFWRAAFATPIGRAELWKVLEEAHTFEDRFACSPAGFPDASATWFNAGQASFGHRLFLSWYNLDPVGVMKMLEEHDPRLQRPKVR